MSAAPFIQNYSGVYPAIFPGKFQQISFSGAASVGVGFSTRTTIVRLFATQDCWVQMGLNPTATAAGPDSFVIRGGIVHFFGVNSGWKISAIQNTVSGVLDILEGSSNNPE